MNIKPEIAILGGSGFVGRNLTKILLEQGYSVHILSRSAAAPWLQNIINKAAITWHKLDVYNVTELQQVITGCGTVINLVGILNEPGHDGSGFHRAHVVLTETAITACQHAKIPQFLQMSGLNAALNAPSHYLRSKAEAEAAVMQAAASFQVTILQPSVIFGPEDNFFNRFAKLLRITPGIFPLACANTRFAPVYVGDVARVFLRAIENPTQYHQQRLPLCGPEEFTLQQLVEYVVSVLNIKRLIVPLGSTLSRLQASIMEYIPGKPFSLDNYLSATIDSICPNSPPQPTHIADIVPEYLQANRKGVSS